MASSQAFPRAGSNEKLQLPALRGSKLPREPKGKGSKYRCTPSTAGGATLRGALQRLGQPGPRVPLQKYVPRNSPHCDRRAAQSKCKQQGPTSAAGVEETSSPGAAAVE